MPFAANLNRLPFGRRPGSLVCLVLGLAATREHDVRHRTSCFWNDANVRSWRHPAVAERGRVAVGGGLNVRWRDGDVGP